MIRKPALAAMTVAALLGGTLSLPVQAETGGATTVRGAGAPTSASTAKSTAKQAPVLKNRRMVALYGTPGTAALGLLGEQSLPKSIKRAKQLAKRYTKHTTAKVVPTFEMISTVAASDAGSDGDYSNEIPVSTLKPWVKAARKAGVYVVLDLQPGRSTFLSQAKLYKSLLKFPNVGLALDPEWRLKPGQHHLEQIGSVSAKEVNQTQRWLARLTRKNDLRQKLLILHQFRTSMVRNRERVRTNRPEVAVLIHADGHGTPGQKKATWRALRKGAKKGFHWGWKNFIDEDNPMLTPKQTMKIRPRPKFVSYQ